jgi:energy-coupling factor transport system ATP-binding protein
VAGVRLQARGWGWRHAARKAWAVRGLDLTVQPGERVLLLGASGAGKSTLLAGIAGLLDPQHSGDEEGELLLDGVPARAARLAAVEHGRARTGLLLQDPQAQTVLARCGDDVAFGLENHAVPAADIWPRVDAALRDVGFRYGRAHPTVALSGGERQRLALAGVLALAPDLLLLDEPTAMLDPDGAELVRASVAAVLAGSAASCLLVEHRVEPWLPLIDRVVVLAAGGGVLADGRPEEVFEAAATELADGGVWLPGLARRLSASLAARPAAAGGEQLIEARALAAGRRKHPPVLTGVNLTLARGRAACLTGPNGSGKSTLALTVAGLAPVLDGELVAAPGLARGVGGQPYRWRARELVSRIGTVFQDPQHQFVAPTVRAELEVGPRQARGTAGPPRDRTVDDLLERLQLAHLARANPFTLSGGEQRRLSVATVLATAPDLLVLDEPTFGQDARTWEQLVSLLLELLDAGTGTLVATHDLELAAVLGAASRGESLELGPISTGAAA